MRLHPRSPTRAAAQLHYCITAALRYCVTALLRYCVTALQRYCVTAFLHYCIPTLLHSYIPTSLHHCITALLHYSRRASTRSIPSRAALAHVSSRSDVLRSSVRKPRTSTCERICTTKCEVYCTTTHRHAPPPANADARRNVGCIVRPPIATHVHLRTQMYDKPSYY